MNLVTFGCSWMFGVGSHYEPGMTKIEYKKGDNVHDPEICDKHAFRKHLCDMWNCTNTNFSQMGASNEQQFRFATRYFSTLDPKEYENTIVLWAITVTTRTETYYKESGKFEKVLFGNGWGFETQMERAKFDTKHHLRYHYNHEHKVEQLMHNMRFWNRFFDAAGIQNYWLDTFNHHDYPHKIDRMLFEKHQKRDLLSLKCEELGFRSKADGYHVSQFSNTDSNRIQFAEEKGWVNPYSQHPTREYHKWIAEQIDYEINGKI